MNPHSRAYKIMQLAIQKDESDDESKDETKQHALVAYSSSSSEDNDASK